jgi:hypothetical protein
MCAGDVRVRCPQAAMYEEAVLAAGESFTMDIVFLPRAIGHTDGVLEFDTSQGPIRVTVRYACRPLRRPGARFPLPCVPRAAPCC